MEAMHMARYQHSFHVRVAPSITNRQAIRTESNPVTGHYLSADDLTDLLQSTEGITCIRPTDQRLCIRLDGSEGRNVKSPGEYILKLRTYMGGPSHRTTRVDQCSCQLSYQSHIFTAARYGLRELEVVDLTEADSRKFQCRLDSLHP